MVSQSLSLRQKLQSEDWRGGLMLTLTEGTYSSDHHHPNGSAFPRTGAQHPTAFFAAVSTGHTLQ